MYDDRLLVFDRKKKTNFLISDDIVLCKNSSVVSTRYSFIIIRIIRARNL